jgi:hypothetical protein
MTAPDPAAAVPEAEDGRTVERLREQLAQAIADRDEVRRYERDNHHNAALCPYCTRVPARDDERERLAAVLRLCDEADSKTSITQGFVAARLIRAALAAAALPEGQEGTAEVTEQ